MADISASILGPSEQSDSRLLIKSEQFVLIMLVASTMGLFSGPLIAPDWWPDNPQKLVGRAFHFTASMHIGLTYFFYVDRDARELVASQRLRFYLIAPSLMVVFFSLFYFGSVSVRNFIWIGLGIWTLWHFQKQNFGVFSLIATARREDRPQQTEIRAIYIGGVAGICMNAIGYGGGLAQLGLPQLVQPVFIAGCLLQIVATGLAALVIYQDRRHLSIRHLFLILFSSYWLTFAFMPWGVAWMTSAAGHGYQYIAIMMLVGAGSGRNYRPSGISRQAAPFLGMAVTVLIGLAVYISADRLLYLIVPKGWQDDALTNGIVGLAFSFTAIHYVLDATIWRLSEPMSRKYVRNKLAFLFG